MPCSSLEVEVLGAVERPADAHLDRARRRRSAPPRSRAGTACRGRSAAEVLVPGVGMRVEVHEPQRPVAARERAQDGQRDRVIAADAERARAAPPPPASSVRSMAAYVRSIEIGTTSTSPQSATRSRSKGCTCSTGFHGRMSEDCSRTARGPEPRARAVRAAAVVGDAEQRHVEPRGRLRVRQQHEGGDLAEAGRREAVALPRMLAGRSMGASRGRLERAAQGRRRREPAPTSLAARCRPRSSRAACPRCRGSASAAGRSDGRRAPRCPAGRAARRTSWGCRPSTLKATTAPFISGLRGP